MKSHGQTLLRRVALALALATLVMSPLPAFGAAHSGHGNANGNGNGNGNGTGSGSGPGSGSGSGGTGCTLDVSRSGQPSVPMVIAAGVFTGQGKGFLPPDGIVLSTRLSNAAWTTFYHELSAVGVTGYIDGPGAIPSLQVGDVINVTVGGSAMGYRPLAATLAPGSTVVAPVVRFGRGPTATVVGFATLRATTIKARGKAKCLQGTLLSVDLDPCFAQP